MTEEAWYAERRAQWMPAHIRLLLIAESAPDDGGDITSRRFFYDDALTGRDGLFREVVRALFDDPKLVSGPGGKIPWLVRMKAAGIYLIDLATVPVTYLSPPERAAALRANIQSTVTTAIALNPVGVVLVKRNVFELLERPILATGLHLLHDEFIPFPASGQQKRFRERFTAALRRLPRDSDDERPLMHDIGDDASEIKSIICELSASLGHALTAFIAGCDEPTLAAWAAGRSAPPAHGAAALRATNDALTIVARADSAAVARAWFMGMNPELGDSSPAEALHAGQLDQVLASARRHAQTS